MAPERLAIMVGKAYLQVRKILLRLKSIWLSQTSSLISTGPPLAEPPTLLIRMSRVPNRSRQVATMASTLAAWVTSQVQVTMELAASPARAKVSAKRSGSRSTARTLAPSCARRTAIARPLPQPSPTQPAPVTIATLFSKRLIACLLCP